MFWHENILCPVILVVKKSIRPVIFFTQKSSCLVILAGLQIVLPHDFYDKKVPNCHESSCKEYRLYPNYDLLLYLVKKVTKSDQGGMGMAVKVMSPPLFFYL